MLLAAYPFEKISFNARLAVLMPPFLIQLVGVSMSVQLHLVFYFHVIAHRSRPCTATSDVTYDVVREDRNVKLTQKLKDLLNYTV